MVLRSFASAEPWAVRRNAPMPILLNAEHDGAAWEVERLVPRLFDEMQPTVPVIWAHALPWTETVSVERLMPLARS